MPTKKDTDDKKVMDVNSPGKAAPSATSRPVIVTHKPMIEDPMVARPNPEVPTAPALAGKGKTIKPRTTAESLPKTDSTKTAKTTKKATATSTIQTPDTPSEDTPTPAEESTADTAPKDSPTNVEVSSTASDEDQAATAEPTATTDEQKTEASESSPPAATDDSAEADTATASATSATIADKKKAEAEAAAQAQQEKYEKMIADKTYFVPIDQSVSSSPAGKVLSFIILFILIAGIAGVLLVDAGIIETSFDLPIDLIQN